MARWSIVETRPMKTLCTVDDPQLRVPPGFLLFIFSPPTALPLHLHGFTSTRCHAGPLPIRDRQRWRWRRLRDNYTIDMLNICRLNHVNKRRYMVNWINHEITDNLGGCSRESVCSCYRRCFWRTILTRWRYIYVSICELIIIT